MSNEHPIGAGLPVHQARVAPFGWWSSPFTASVVAAGKVSRSGLQGDGDSFFWSESRPSQGGRQVVVRAGGGGPPEEVSPSTASVRSRVHEYGGGAATVADGVLFFVEQADQRVYRSTVGTDGPATALTPAPGPGGVLSSRFADGRVMPSGRWLVCIEERHGREPHGEERHGEERHGAPETSHRLVAVATDGSQRMVPLVGDRHFLTAPRPSPDGTRLAWVAWDHPHMSWDESELWVGRLVEHRDSLRVTDPYRVAGGGGVSVGQPLWCRDGSLLFVDDRTGWWLPYRVPGWSDPGKVDAQAMVAVEGEFHAPDWVVGQSTMAELADRSVVCRVHSGGRDHLVRLVPPDVVDPADQVGSAGQRSAEPRSAEPRSAEPRSAEPRSAEPRSAGPWAMEPVDQPCVTIAGVAATAGGRRLAVLGATPTAGATVYEVAPDRSGRWSRLAAAPPLEAAVEDVAPARPFVATTAAGSVPGLFYAPTNAGVVGPAGERPPLVVFCHGGPTGAAEPGFDPVVQFFTSQGLAVAAVDYRGSSGYGREYRRRLQGLWGEADVDDCVAYAAALVDEGWVDGGRMAIRGTSAGGLTALAALTRSDRFVGAAAWYGVTDLEALAADTHDFEARYLDSLVGLLPDDMAVYRRRSPIHHPDAVSGAVLLMQGADDPVVPAAQSEQFAEALAAHGVPCRLEVFPGESHGFRRAATIEACLQAELDFYRSIFGAEPPPGPPPGPPHVVAS